MNENESKLDLRLVKDIVSIESIFEDVRNRLSESIMTVGTSDDLKTRKKLTSKYFEVMALLKDIELLENDTPTLKPKTTAPVQFIPKEREPSADEVGRRITKEDSAEADWPKTLELDRKLRGGTLHLNGKEIFVPEHTVRDKGLEHGDMVSVMPDEGHRETTDDQPRYKFELSEKCAKAHDEIVEIERAVLEYVPEIGSFIIKKKVTDEGDIKIGDTGDYLKVNVKDATYNNLETGSIADVAYYKGNDIARIRHVYNVNFGPTRTPKPSSFYKVNEKSDTDAPPQIFEGKTIAITSIDSQETAFREEIESRGGELVVIDTSNRVSVQQRVQGTDFVVLAIRSSGHIVCELAKEFAKQYDIPYKELDTNGRTSFVRLVSEGLGVEGE